MAAIYQWFETDIQYLTTTLYPVEAIDGMSLSLEPIEGSMRLVPDEHLKMSASFISGDLVQVYQVTGPYDEQLEMSATFISGDLVQVYLSTGPYDEQLEMSATFISGDLQRGLIYATMPDDGLGFILECVAGSMTLA